MAPPNILLKKIGTSLKVINLPRYKVVRKIYPSFSVGEKITDPSQLSNKKILVIFACHTSSEIKLKAILNNLRYLKKSKNTDFVIVNTIHLEYSETLKNTLLNKCLYYEIENTNTFDFGKWIYALENVDYNDYNHIIFTNDSYIIHNHIDNFLYNAAITSTELYGYNDSTQNAYHYQSYLFSIKSFAVQKFINMYRQELCNIHSQQDVIDRYELKMPSFFNGTDCYLKIGKVTGNMGRNIFFENDRFYKKLQISGLLPFTKIKRLL